MNILAKIKKLSKKDVIIYKNVIGAFAVKGASLILSLFTMPAYMRFFTDEQVLGVWFTLLSVLSWILNFDLGIGNGLRNKLAEALAIDDRKSAKEYISSAYWMIGLMMLVVGGVGLPLLPYISWNSVFNVSPTFLSSTELSSAVQWCFMGVVLQFFLRLISSVLYAMQKSAVNNFLMLLTSVLQLLVALLAPSRMPAENLRMFARAYVVCVNLPLLVASVVVFSGTMRDCIPRFRSFDQQKAKAVLSLGGIFFVCQVLYMLIANTNEILITQYTDPANVVEYQIYNKLFTLAGTLFMLALTPVWSAVTKAVAEKDYRWIKKLIKILLWLSLLATFVEFLIVPFLQPIVNIWLGDKAISVNYIYAFCFAFFGSAMVFQSAISTIANGTGRVRTQAICYGGGIVVKLLIIHFGVAISGSWIVIILANALILFPYCIIQWLEINRTINREIQRGTKAEANYSKSIG